jgi:hypothetical protein
MPGWGGGNVAIVGQSNEGKRLPHSSVAHTNVYIKLGSPE